MLRECVLFICRHEIRLGRAHLWSPVLFCLLIGGAYAEDVVELITGARLTGTVTAIRTTEKTFDFESKIGQQTVARTFQFSEVHAVTLKGKRHVLTPLREDSETSDPPKRTAAEVRASILAAAGVPDWYESTE